MNSTNSGIFFSDLTELGLIAFTGSDAQSFLHGQLTCDVAGMPPQSSTYGGYCSPKGRLLATFLLWRTADGFLMQLPTVLREPIQKRLSMFILRAKVKAQDATGAFALLGICGGKAKSELEALFGAVPQKPHTLQVSGNATLIRLPGDRFEIVAPAAEAESLRARLAACAAPAGYDAWMRKDIQSGVVVILPATQEAFVPQMVNLDLIGAVSYTKGCYPGQEIVARTHYLGRIKQRAYRAWLGAADAPPKPGDSLYSTAFGDQASGTVVNTAPALEGGYELLTVIQTASAAGTVCYGAPNGPPIELRALPYTV
jgi:folate-binding protein YgfZ